MCVREIEPALDRDGRARRRGELYREQLADRENEPRLIQWDAWGNRVDRIEVTPLWRKAERIAAEQGLVAIAYERKHGAHSRVHQFALAYLFTPSTDIYSCPLAMTDGAARALIASGNRALIERALPHLTSRDPATFWTSGQWMTEATGGSDVGLSQTVAREERRRMAAVRPQVVHFGDRFADGAHARAARRQSGRRQRARAVLRRDARRSGALERHRGQSPEGQARHAQSADGRAHARRHARRARLRHDRTASRTSRRCST